MQSALQPFKTKTRIIYDDFPGNPNNERSANAAYIAAAHPATVLSLIAEVRRLKGELLFYACDSATCDCVPGKEDKDNVCCGYRARTALGDTNV